MQITSSQILLIINMNKELKMKNKTQMSLMKKSLDWNEEGTKWALDE